mgnify:CR=1 FL=1
MATKRVNIDIVAKDKTRQALSGVQRNLTSLKNNVFSLKGALVGIGAGAVVKSFVDVGREVESLQTRFKFLFGSVEEGQVAFEQLRKFASRVPFSLEEISRASGNLAVVSKDAEDLNRVLSITGNVAAVTGLDFETTASQIQRAFSGGIGAADLFRERGVRALLGFKAGVQVTAEETIERFEELFGGNGKFATATDDLATTLTGTLSMLGDKFFNFQTVVAESFFDELKKEFGDLDKFLQENEQQIEDIATAIGENFAGAITKTSQVIKDIAPAIKTVADALGTTITGFQSLPPFVQTGGIIGALLFGKKGLLAIGAITFLVGQIQDLISEAKNVSELKLLDPKDIDSIGELNLLIDEFKKQRNDIISEMNNPESLIPVDVLIEELAEVDGAINNLKKRIKEINFVEAMSKEVSEFSKVIADAKNETDDLIIKIKKKPPVPEGFGDAEEEIVKLIENVGLLDNDFIDLFDTLAEKKAFNKLVQDGKKVEEQLTFMQQATKDFKDGFNEAMNDSTFDSFVKAGQDAFKSLQSTLTDFIMTGKLNFQSLAQSIIRSLVEALVGKAITAAIAKSEGMMIMSSIRKAMISVYEGALKTFASIPFPFNILAVGAAIKFGMGLVNKIRGFEKGGRPPVGQPSIVGERGPELFMPDQAGTIVPNNQLGMGQPVTVNFNINTVDARGFNELLVNSRGTIVNMINNAVNEKGKMAII